MTTKPPAEINYSDPEKLIKKIYNAIDELADFIPLPNDRNRVSFCINMYFNNETETILNAIMQAQPRSSKVDFGELEKIIVKKFEEKGITKT
jgi:predicted transcriptional regulator YheO